MIAVGAALALVGPVTALGAAPAEPAEPALEIGPWNLLGEATGRASGSNEGVDISFFGRFPVAAQVSVPSEGGPVGDWEITGGQGTLTVTGSGLDATATATATGSGQVGGTASVLELTGPVTVDATATVVVAGQEVTQTASNTVDGIMRWRVLGEVCDQAWGEWIFQGDLELQGGFFDLVLEGRFTGFRGDDFVVDDIDQLLDAVSGATETPEGTQAGIFDASAELITTYNRLVDDVPFDQWTLADVTAIAERAEQLLALLDEFTDCDRRLFGEDNIARVKNGLTWSLQGVLISLASRPEPIPSTAFSHLAHLGARAGAFGPGAENPSQAVAAEEALRLQGQAILDANADAEGFVEVNPDTERVIITGAAMNWQFNVGTGLKPAAEIYANTFGSDTPAPEADADGGGDS